MPTEVDDSEARSLPKIKVSFLSSWQVHHQMNVFLSRLVSSNDAGMLDWNERSWGMVGIHFWRRSRGWMWKPSDADDENWT